MSDASVAVDTTTPNAVRATSLTGIGPWMTSTSFAGWHGNFGGTGTARNAGSRPYYQGDGTSANPGTVVRQAITRFAEVADYLIINAFSYNSATGNPWPDPTADCPASDTTTYPYFGGYLGGSSPGTGAIAFRDASGWFWPPTPANGIDQSNPWATLDVKVFQALTMTSADKIVLCLRACPPWMTAAWDGSTTNGGTPNIDTPTEPQKVNGNPPLFMRVVASGTAATSIGFCGWFQSGVSAGASGGTLKAAGTGMWGSGTALIGLANGDTLILAPGTANEETVTLSALNTSTGVFSISGTFAHAHAANILAVKLGGTRIISSFFGGNTCSSGLAASGYSPGTGNVWTFFDCMARLARRVAERYPFIQLYSSWGEPGNTTKAAVTSTNDTGAWLQTNNVWWNDSTSPGASGACSDQASPAYTTGGRNNIPIATVLYNRCWQALKGVPGRNYTAFPLLFGGPHHSCSPPTNATTLVASDDGVYTVFLTNAAGLDFVSFDGFTYGNTYAPTAPDPDPSSALASLADATTGLLAGIGAVRTKATAFGYGALPILQMESYHDSNLSHLDYSNPSQGPAVTNWFTSQAQAMCLSSILYYAILGGVALHARWQAEGSASSSSFNGYIDAAFGSTYNVESLVSVTDVAGTGLGAAVLGMPFPTHAAFKAVHDYFPPGTALKATTVTDASATAGKTILALASATTLLLINQYPVSKSIDVRLGGTTIRTLTTAGYSITTFVFPTPSGGGALPDTTTLDIASMGGPALGLVQITSATPFVSTASLDTASMGGPYTALYSKIYPFALAGSLSPSGALATIKGKPQAFAASVSLSGTIARVTSKTFSAAPAISGSLTKAQALTFTAGVTLSGSIAKRTNKVFTPTLVLTPAFSGPNGSEQTTNTRVAVLANQGTIILSIQPYKPP